MKDIFLDANIILRYLLQDNKEQVEKANELFTSQNNSKLWVHSLIIAEVYYVLVKVYELSKIQASTQLATFCAAELIHCIEKQILLSTFALNKKYGLGFADSFGIVFCLEHNLQFVSFDKKANSLYEKLKSKG
jgi:predicted nucleic acid-binding protein